MIVGSKPQKSIYSEGLYTAPCPTGGSGGGPAELSFLLLEDSSLLLQEDGSSFIKLEESL